MTPYGHPLETKGAPTGEKKHVNDKSPLGESGKSGICIPGHKKCARQKRGQSSNLIEGEMLRRCKTLRGRSV